MWIHGPIFLRHDTAIRSDTFELQSPEEDLELRPVSCMKMAIQFTHHLGTARFEKFSQWLSLVRAIALLMKKARRYIKSDESVKAELDVLHTAENLIIREVQHQVYGKHMDHGIASLNPNKDKSGILRVGGRLDKADIGINMKHPILIPGKHYIAKVLVWHFHNQVLHQGRHITEGAVREAGYWITGAKRLVLSIIHQCVKCRRLRGSMQTQKMADLPQDRLVPGPPFTSVGVDCFGPWQVSVCRTRGGQANNQRWAVMFTCMATRAVHIEVIEELSSSSFINALRRFTAIRGKVKIYRSDRGTNFVGAADELGINVKDDKIMNHLSAEGSTWIFNPPHASHMGGVWERMIGVARRILDSILMDVPGNSLTHEVLITLLAEVSAIINSRPLVPVSSDPDNPYPLSPSLLLTQKSDSVVDIVVPSTAKDMIRAQWKRVQILSDMFWNRWKAEFLQTLQKRRKWSSKNRNLQVGDVVLLRDRTEARNSWPIGLVTEVKSSDDGKVRSASVRVMTKNKKFTQYVRPVVEMVLLVPSFSDI